MKLLRFIVKSYVFKRLLLASAIFIITIYLTNLIFDATWEKTSALPLLDLNIVYKPPKHYDNFKKLNVKLTENIHYAIEGNKKFRIEGKLKPFDYYDSVQIVFPDKTQEVTNRIRLQFEDSPDQDSISIVVTKFKDEKLYWNQIFYTSVNIEKLNEFSSSPEEFRINKNNLVEQQYLDDNDTLIYKVLKYMETHKDKLYSPECGIYSLTFKDISAKFNLPCRILVLQGGNAELEGFDFKVGYPLHVICEIYSSKYKKWYVIDPLYGLRFKNAGSDDYLNAVEISNLVFFQREKFIIQDSILTNMRSLLGRDYFKFYENIYYFTDINFFNPLKKVMQILYKRFVYEYYHYTNNLMPVKNGFYYVIFKTILFLFLTLLLFNVVLLLIAGRLFSLKKPKSNNL